MVLASLTIGVVIIAEACVSSASACRRPSLPGARCWRMAARC
jgi:hypothetical protein